MSDTVGRYDNTRPDFPMKVIGVDVYGGPEALKAFDLPEPHAGEGEVRIRVHAAAVNPTDTILRAGLRAEAYAKFTPPFVPGMDAAGVVDEIGPSTDTTLAVGDRVMAVVLPSGSHGAYSEYVVVPVDSVVKSPEGSTHAEACTLPMNGLTARLTLDRLALPAGSSIAVTGAAGAYGGYVVQLAKAAGLRVLADAGPGDVKLLVSLGADVVVPRGDDVAEAFRRYAHDGVDAVADGALLFHKVFPALRLGGALATVRPYPGEAPAGLNVVPIWVREYIRERGKLDELARMAEAGKISLRVAAVLPAEEAAEAHRMLEAGGTRGRVVLEF